ncbi:MAG: hypothetical protein KIH65_003825 [Candidatus Uhrbacteria bacterium]|nr:hypothetical protein [Candidatus Uhrbacteria bacterium]
MLIPKPAYRLRIGFNCHETALDATVIQKLVAEGHRVESISFHDPQAHRATVAWIEEYDISVSARILGRDMHEGDIAKDYDVILHDDAMQAEEYFLFGTVHVYFLTRTSNGSIETSPGITHVPSFEAFYEHFTAIYQRQYHYPSQEREQT